MKAKDLSNIGLLTDGRLTHESTCFVLMSSIWD
jgi:hypothetical protein